MVIPKEYRKLNTEPLNVDEARRLQFLAAEKIKLENLQKSLGFAYAAIREAVAKGLSGTRIQCDRGNQELIEKLRSMGYDVELARDVDCDYEKILGFDVSW